MSFFDEDLPVCLSDPVLSPFDAEGRNLILSKPDVATKEEDHEAGTDSGYSSSHSRTQSESSDTVDPWTVHTVYPSTMFASMSPWGSFDIWSPTSEDDSILQMSLLDSNGTISSRHTSLFGSGPLSPERSDEFSDDADWGSFLSWDPVPSVQEAEILHEIELQEEAIIHERAALKRKEKTAKYFEMVRHRQKHHKSQ